VGQSLNLEIKGYQSSAFSKAVAEMDADARDALRASSKSKSTITKLKVKFSNSEISELSRYAKQTRAAQVVFHSVWKAMVAGKSTDTALVDVAYADYGDNLAMLQMLNQRWEAMLAADIYKTAAGWQSMFLKWAKQMQAQIGPLEKDLKKLEALLKKLKRRDKIESSIQLAIDGAFIVTSLMFPPARGIQMMARAVGTSALSLTADAMLGPSAPDLFVDGSSTVLSVGSSLDMLAKHSVKLNVIGTVMSVGDSLQELGQDSKDVEKAAVLIKGVKSRISSIKKFHKKNAGALFRLEQDLRRALKGMKKSYQAADDAKATFEAYWKAAQK